MCSYEVDYKHPKWEECLAGRFFPCDTDQPSALPVPLSQSKSTCEFTPCQASWENRHRVSYVTQARVCWDSCRGGVGWPLSQSKWVIRVLTIQEHSSLVIKDLVFSCQTIGLWDDEIYHWLCGFSLGEAMPHCNSVPGPEPTSPHRGHLSLLLQKLAHSMCAHVCLCVFMSVCLCGYVY